MDKFEKRNEQWNKMFDLASLYYNHHGNLNVHQKFKTINGYEYDENGASLGMWVSAQKFRDISDEQRQKLLSIGMNFECKKRNFENVEKIILLEKYGIPQEYIPKLLKHSYDDLVTKLNLFINNKIQLFINGKLNSIFYLNTNEIEEKYGIGKKDNPNLEIEKNEDIEKITFRKKEFEKIKKVMLLEKCGLNTEQISKLINISYEELVLKVNVMYQNKIPLIVNGNINDAFFLRLDDFLLKYNIEYINKKRGK